MVPRLREGLDLAEHCLQPLCDFAAAREKHLRKISSLRLERCPVGKTFERAMAGLLRSRRPGSDVFGTDRLRPECRIVRIGLKRDVHFRGTPAQ